MIESLTNTTGVAILGSTGSIGCNSLRVIESLTASRMRVVALAAGTNVERLADQIATHLPEVVSVDTETAAHDLRAMLFARDVDLPRILIGEPLGQTLYVGLGAFLFGHFMAKYWLKGQADKRIRAVTHALPDSLDLMVVCLEAGIGLNAAIARVGEERSDFKDPLGMEFRQIAAEMRGGRPREEALHDLGERNGVEDLKSLTALVIQSHRLGASMARTLRSHADMLRTKRRQRAEEAARKLPIKVLIPLATLLLPPLFVVVAGPAFLAFGDLIDVIVNR